MPHTQLSQEEFLALSEEKRKLVALERMAEKSYAEIQEEFYKEIGRINPLRFKTLVEKHCSKMMQLLYETIQRDKEAYRIEGPRKYY